MDRDSFEQLVAHAVESLPEEFLEQLENIDIVVEDEPSEEQLEHSDLDDEEDTLLGLYEGVPLTRRSSFYGMVLPDKISIFQKPIEEKCRDDASDVTREIQRVVIHEIAHHFGIGDERLDELEGE